MNYITQINEFWTKSENDDLKPIDIATYFALLNYCNRLNWLNPFVCHWDIVCQNSKSSKNSFYTSINKLDSLGYIKYSKGKRNVLQPKVSILVLKNRKGTQKEQNREQKGNIYKQVNNQTNKLIKVYEKNVHTCFDKCLVYFPEYLHPKENNSWLDVIDKLNSIDKIPFDQIINIVKATRNNDFWAKNFLSLTKLRKKNKDGVKYIVVFNEQTKTTQNEQDERFKQISDFTNEIRDRQAVKRIG